MINRNRLRRWHIWLGWILAIPMLFWTISGVVMVVKPNDEVRGNHLMAPPPPMRLGASPVAPRITGIPLSSIGLQQRAAGPRWVIKTEDGTTRQADPATGALIPSLSAADAAREVMARYTGKARIEAVTRIDPANPPFDLRQEIPAWQVRMTDGTHFYVDSRSGEVVARRTRWWRFYDFMWGLHIMDPQTRVNTSNPWIITFGIIASVTTVLAIILLPLTIRRNRRKGAARPAG